MPDDIGVRVWISPATGCAYHSPRTDTNPHLAIPLDAESLARLRERIEQAMADGTSIRWLGDECQFEYVYDADAVLAALGLDPS